MDLGIANILLAVGAGLASVLSPCVLPVITATLPARRPLMPVPPQRC